MPARPAPIADPYATLGLEPGSSMADVKRAYRQLAKTFHPDSAGEKAIPRFLAIQAAYEQIRTGRVVLGGSRAGRGPAAGATGQAATGPSEPWRADPARARAARERARTGTSSARAAGGAGATSGASSTGARGAGGRSSTGTSGTTGGGTKRRSTRKATMGSTSYDEARDPADATWSGASWYGPSTGEYWIVNPREYADPRKHGPDYQQRARRLAQDAADEPPPPTIVEQATASAEAAAPAPGAAAAPAGAAPARRARQAPRWTANTTETGWAPAGEPRAAAADIEERAAPPRRWVGEPSDDPIRRLGLALVAWPPIGLVMAAVIGNATGCGALGGTCDGAEPMLPWLSQAVLLGLLLLLPPLARVLATGTVAILIGLLPITLFLVAIGPSSAQQAAPMLVPVFGAIYGIGIGWAVYARSRPAGSPGARA